MDLQKYKQRLQEVKKQLENNEIDEIPLDARPKMLDFDFDKESFIVVSYSRKDFLSGIMSYHENLQIIVVE